MLDEVAASSLSASMKKALAYSALRLAMMGDASSSNPALVAHEAAVQAASAVFGTRGVGDSVLALRRVGREGLARRLRASARSRGALAHPDTTLAGAIERTREQPSCMNGGGAAVSVSSGCGDACGDPVFDADPWVKPGLGLLSAETSAASAPSGAIQFDIGELFTNTAMQTTLSMLHSCMLGDWPRDAEDLANTSGTDHGDDHSGDLGKSSEGATSIGDATDSDVAGKTLSSERIGPTDFGAGIAHCIVDGVSTYASGSSGIDHASDTGDTNMDGNRNDVGMGSARFGSAACGGGGCDVGLAQGVDAGSASDGSQAELCMLVSLDLELENALRGRLTRSQMQDLALRCNARRIQRGLDPVPVPPALRHP